MAGPDAELWDMNRVRWRLFGTRYLWHLVLGPVLSTIGLVAAFGHTHAGARPVLTVWLPVVVLLDSILLYRVFTSTLEIDDAEIVVRNVFQTSCIARADLMSIGSRSSFNLSRVASTVLQLCIRDDTAGQRRVPIDVSLCPTVLGEEAYEHARRLSSALGVSLDVTAPVDVAPRQFDRWLDSPEGRRARRSAGRPINRPASLGRSRRPRC